ncbi:hypothetical protein D9M72_371050 [compost metagenome]
MASSGNSAIIGIAAMSWNSRMPKLAAPAGVPKRLRSVSVASAIAVDDNASPRPATSATCHGAPASAATAPITSAQAASCAPP